MEEKINDKHTTKQRNCKMKRQKHEYLNNDEFADELQKWIDSSENIQDRIITDKLALMIRSIPENMIRKYQFNGYDQELKEDMIANAVLKCLKNLKNYNPARRNSAFNYFTLCTHCSFMTTLHKHYKQLNLKKELYELVEYYQFNELPDKPSNILHNFEG